MLFNNQLCSSSASNIFITRIYFVLAVYPRKTVGHIARSILRDPTFESGLHGSMELFSGFRVEATVRSSFLRPTVYENLRVRICVLTHVIARRRPRRAFVFRDGDRSSIGESRLHKVKLLPEYVIQNCYNLFERLSSYFFPKSIMENQQK